MYELVQSSGLDMIALHDLVRLTEPKITLPLRYATTDVKKTNEVFHEHLKDLFPGEWIKCFCSIINPDGSIMPHADVDANGRTRCHLVLKTNKDCWHMHDNEWQQLKEGEVYSMDPTKVHAAINWGEEPRVSFVVDRLKGEPN